MRLVHETTLGCVPVAERRETIQLKTQGPPVLALSLTERCRRDSERAQTFQRVSIDEGDLRVG